MPRRSLESSAIALPGNADAGCGFVLVAQASGARSRWSALWARLPMSIVLNSLRSPSCFALSVWAALTLPWQPQRKLAVKSSGCGRGQNGRALICRIGVKSNSLSLTLTTPRKAIEAETLTLAQSVLDACRARNWKLATAESCTGGLVVGALTAIGGSSDVVERGFVAYSNGAKSELLGVPPEIIAEHGAVSAETAAAMAQGAPARAPVDLAISVIGIAGPGG